MEVQAGAFPQVMAEPKRAASRRGSAGDAGEEQTQVVAVGSTAVHREVPEEASTVEDQPPSTAPPAFGRVPTAPSGAQLPAAECHSIRRICFQAGRISGTSGMLPVEDLLRPGRVEGSPRALPSRVALPHIEAFRSAHRRVRSPDSCFRMTGSACNVPFLLHFRQGSYSLLVSTLLGFTRWGL